MPPTVTEVGLSLLVTRAARAAAVACVVTALLTGCSLAERAVDAGASAAQEAVSEQLSSAMEKSLGQSLAGAGSQGAAQALASSASAISALDGTGATRRALRDALADLGWHGSGSKLLGVYDVSLDGLTATVSGSGSCWQVHARKGDDRFSVRPCPA